MRDARSLESPAAPIPSASSTPWRRCKTRPASRRAPPTSTTACAVKRAAPDAAYVSGLCDRLGVPLDAECVDVAALAKESRRSLEEAGRLARYDFFARVAHRRGAGAVLVAHTADDQAETVLLHLTRGAGLAGLGGMRSLASWRSPEGEVRVGRPLLGLTRADTEAYCAARELRPRLDSSNASLDFARNRIRHDVVLRPAGDQRRRGRERRPVPPNLPRKPSTIWKARPASGWRRTLRPTAAPSRCRGPRSRHSTPRCGPTSSARPSAISSQVCARSARAISTPWTR